MNWEAWKGSGLCWKSFYKVKGFSGREGELLVSSFLAMVGGGKC